MKELFDNYAISEPLEPRDAFFGGPTNATRLLYETQPNEKIQYVDFCSLYPWCNKYGEYPPGHPQIITKNFRPIDQYFGMVKCTVLPPRQLYHPVLPYSTQGKLMFPLWRTCADTMQQESCHNTDADRAMHGTWVTLELEKALQKGYQLLKTTRSGILLNTLMASSGTTSILSSKLSKSQADSQPNTSPIMRPKRVFGWIRIRLSRILVWGHWRS